MKTMKKKKSDHESDAGEGEGDVNAPALPHLHSPHRVGLSEKALI